MKLYPGASRLLVLGISLAGLLSAGCRSSAARWASEPPPAPIPPPTTRPVEVLNRPAIDLTRGGTGFPLDVTQPPASIIDLTNALARAYANRLDGQSAPEVRAEGASVQQLDELAIDLSDSRVKSTFAPQPPPKVYTGMPFLTVARMRYVADPLHYLNYSASLILEASNAEMALFTGADGKLSLIMTDCQVGSARLRVEMDDLREGLLAAARLRRSPAMSIDGMQLRLVSHAENSLEADVLIQASVLLVPASFRLTGRVDIDDDFNVYFTRLRATGLDAGGAVLAGVVQARLDQYNNKAAPLLRLPGNRVRVTDLKLSLDQALTVDVRFAGTRGLCFR